jgi:hypothetical protein
MVMTVVEYLHIELMTPDEYSIRDNSLGLSCCMFSRVITKSFTTLHIPRRIAGYRTMSNLPFTNLKEETDLAILAVLRACTL